MFQKVGDAEFVRGEHDMLRFWTEQQIFARLRRQNVGKPPWSFLDGPITANNPMGVHHAWGRTYKDAFQRYWAMNGRELRYQNGFDCQGLWVEVEVEKQLGLGAKSEIEKFGIDRFVWECKKRVLKYAAIQTEQSIRLGYWMEWDDPQQLRRLASAVGTDEMLEFRPPKQVDQPVRDTAERIVERLGNPDWGGSYFTFSTENNETIWAFLKKCFERGKVYRGHDVMPWSGKAGSAYSQMEVADGRKLTVHRALFVRFPILAKGVEGVGSRVEGQKNASSSDPQPSTLHPQPSEYLLVWTTTPWTLTSNVAAMVNPDLEYVKLQSKRDGVVYYFAKDNLEYQRLAKEFKEGFGRPEWGWPKDCPKLKTLAQIFKEQGGFELAKDKHGDVRTIKGEEMIGWRYRGPFDDLEAQQQRGGYPPPIETLGAQLSPPLESVFYKIDLAFQSIVSAQVLILDGITAKKGQLAERQRHITDLQDPFAMSEEAARIKDEIYFLNQEKSQALAALVRATFDRFNECAKYVLDAAFIQGCIGTWAGKIEVLADTRLALTHYGIGHASSSAWRQLEAVLRLSKHWLHHGQDYTIAKLGSDDDWAVISDWETVDATQKSISDGFMDELKARQYDILRGIATEFSEVLARSGATCHRVIDGGRDFKGNPNVVAGEGTGIVHSAPGCGDIDYQIGKQYGLVSIAPLGEDGRFLEGFGQFTGMVATAPETVDLIIEDLKKKELLVAIEKYPHIYPFCWRTGDELVFRLVDEWFINMDWRDEIMDVTRQIKWLPDSIQGQEREVEWLTNMRDWMVSKKRYWGLALPIWINPEDPSDFEVIGSLAELKERAVEGTWEEFAGEPGVGAAIRAAHEGDIGSASDPARIAGPTRRHTPHKPWIDRVRIKSQKTGAVLTRIPDVGNPWLDAGIVPFSTLGFRTHTELWKQWYPADLVTECFPGQFRNWFYSMLAMSTMMRHEQPDAEHKKPFKTLLGHRLVMNEHGEPMSKSKGTAIWFEEAAEQLGVDTMRWMYLAQNPAQDLRFGTRNPDQHVTLQTVNGPTDTTIDGVPTCLVNSGPADEVRRLVLLPLWNSYAFFVNYAILDEFDPSKPQVPFRERPQIDQWILTNLEDTIGKVRKGYEDFDTPAVCRALAHFIDDLSNWYIRRNRKRFWRSRREVEGLGSRIEGQKYHFSSDSQPSTLNPQPAWDPDKLAAYQTLYRALVTVSKLMAPAIPFLAERMYRNLVCSWDETAPLSVHLCEFPREDTQWEARSLLEPMETAQQIVRMGHRLRETIDQRVRQPLAEVRVASSSSSVKDAAGNLAELIADELNVKHVRFVETLSNIVAYRFRANPASLGKKHGKLLAKLRDHIATLPTEALSPLRDGKLVRITLDGTEIELTPEDVSVSVENAEGWASAAEGQIEIALSTVLTPELLREGMARDFVRQVQQLRKDADLEIEQRIRIEYFTTDANALSAVREWSEYIRTETLADELLNVEGIPEDARTVAIGEARVRLQIEAVDGSAAG